MPSPPSAVFMRRPALAFVVLACIALVWFALLPLRDLTEPDEGRYAEIAREMAHADDWVVPRLNGLVYLEKPPMQYWLTAGWFRVAGVSEFGARLWPALAGLLTVALVGAWVARRRGTDAGLDTALMLGSAVLFMGYGQVITLDMGLTVFMTAALVAWLRAMEAEAALADVGTGRSSAAAPDRRGAAAVFWLALAGALLSKGLVGVVLPGAAVVLACGLLRSLLPLTCLRPLAGIPLLLAVSLPWHLLAQAREPAFFDFYIVGEHFGRFTQAGHNRPGPWWSIAVAGWAGLLPWSGLLLPALAATARRVAMATRRGWRTDGTRTSPGAASAPAIGTASRAPDPESAALVQAASWMVVIVVFFSLSSSKLPGYVLPALPAAAILMGLTLRFDGAAGRVAVPVALVAMGALLAGLGWYGARWDKIGESLVDPTGFRLAFGLGALTVSAAAVAAWSARDLSRRIRAAALPAALAMASALMGIQQATVVFSTRTLVAAVPATEPMHDPAVPFYAFHTYDQTLPYYLGRTVTLVEYEDEFALGMRLAPERAIRDRNAFAERWRAQTVAYALMDQDALAKAKALDLPMRVVARTSRQVIVARHDAASTPAR